MTPFYIHCTTCKARLKVRDAYAVGLIFSCPKCGSMVQVIAPPGWQPPPGEAAGPAAGDTDMSSGEFAGLNAPTGPRPRWRDSPPEPGTESITLEFPMKPVSDSGLPVAGAASAAAAAAAAGTPTPSDAAEPPADQSADDFDDGAEDGESASEDLDAGDVDADEVDATDDHDADEAAEAMAEVPVTRGPWLVIGGAAAAGLLILSGVVWYAMSGAEEPPTEIAVADPAQPSSQQVAQDAAAPPADPDAPKTNATAAVPEAPPETPLVNLADWLPANAQLVVEIRPAAVESQPPLAGALAAAAPQVRAALAPALAATGIAAGEVEAALWANRDLARATTAASPADVIVLRTTADVAAERFAKAGWNPTELEIGDKDVLGTAKEKWPHPLLLVDRRTLVTGPAELLEELAAGKRLSGALATVREHALAQTQICAAMDAAALRAVSKETLAQIELFGLGPSWPIVTTEPTAVGLSFASGESHQAKLVLACEAPSSGERLRAAVESCAAVAEEKLLGEQTAISDQLVAGKLNAATAEQVGRLVGAVTLALQSRKVGGEGPLVWVETSVPGDLAALASAEAAGRQYADARQLELAATLGQTRLERLGAGLVGYEKAERHFPDGAGGAGLLAPETRLSWIATLLPYYDRLDWHRELRFSRNWNDPANRPVTERPLDLVLNPLIQQTATENGFPVTHFVGMAGVGADAAQLPANDPRAGLFGYGRTATAKSIADGASNTLAIVGVSNHLGPWASGGQATVRPLTKAPYVNGADGFGSGQADGMFAAMADGSVRFISKDIDPKVMERLATVAGGEPISPSEQPRLLGPLANARPGADKPPAAVEPPMPSDAAPAADADVATAAATPAPPMADPQQDAEDLARRLAMPIGAVDFQQVALDDLLQLVSRASGLPITLDAEAIVNEGREVQMPVTFRGEPGTVEGLLDAVLEPLALVRQADGRQLIVTTADAREPTVSKQAYEIGDLAPTSPNDVAGLVTRFVEPLSWEAKGGSGRIAAQGRTLHVENSDATQRSVVAFLDQLRAARQLLDPANAENAQLRNEAEARLRPRFALADERLMVNVTVNFTPSAPLARVLAYLSEISQLQLIVDYPSLAAQGVAGDTPITLAAESALLAEVLAAGLESKGLAFRVLDAKTLLVTTRAAADARADIVLVDVAPHLASDPDGAQLIEKIKAELAPSSWDDTGGTAAIALDAPSRRLVVRHTQDVLRRLAAQWGPASGKQKAKPVAAGAVPAGPSAKVGTPTPQAGAGAVVPGANAKTRPGS